MFYTVLIVDLLVTVCLLLKQRNPPAFFSTITLLFSSSFFFNHQVQGNVQCFFLIIVSEVLLIMALGWGISTDLVRYLQRQQ